ncbi:hypothetical protein [Bauldia litoralis]|uniref:hypothetical protein n=1 Tax=Bauldia litoralis TaxID=665467 RepID=UPI0032645313
MPMNAIRRGFADTFGHLKTFGFAVLGAIISLVALYFWKGRDMAIDEVPFVTVGLIGAFGSVALILIWNLVCAPYRIQKDRADALAVQLARMPKPKQTPITTLDPTDAARISRVAREFHELLQKQYDPVAHDGWDIVRMWEARKLTYEAKNEFISALTALSERTYRLRFALQPLLDKNEFDQQRFAFIKGGLPLENELKGTADFYNNAIRELHPQQDPEILRLYNMQLGERTNALEYWTEKQKEKLRAISDDPSAAN